MSFFFFQNLFTDITIVSGDGVRFPCHSLVLVASSEFLRHWMETTTLINNKNVGKQVTKEDLIDFDFLVSVHPYPAGYWFDRVGVPDPDLVRYSRLDPLGYGGKDQLCGGHLGLVHRPTLEHDIIIIRELSAHVLLALQRYLRHSVGAREALEGDQNAV